MITVAELKASREDLTEKFIEELDKNIKHMDSRGKRSYSVDLKKNVNVDTIMETLVNAGFIVSRNNGSDDRGDSWDILHIHWE